MKLWCTEIRALEASTGLMKTWAGDHVEGITWKDAQDWCDENKGYLKVVGELVAEIPCKENSFEPDWDKRIDYDTPQNN